MTGFLQPKVIVHTAARTADDGDALGITRWVGQRRLSQCLSRESGAPGGTWMQRGMGGQCVRATGFVVSREVQGCKEEVVKGN